MIKIGLTGITGTLGFALCHEIAVRQKVDVRIKAYHRLQNKAKLETAQRTLPADKINWVAAGSEELDLDASRQVMADTDVFVHFAAWTAHKIPQEKAAEFIKVNVLWPAILCRLALESRTLRFIFASSRMVYTLAKVAPEGATEDVEFDLSQYQEWLTKVLPQIYTYAGEFIRRTAEESPQEFTAYLLGRNPIPNGTGDIYALSKYMGEKIISTLWDSGREGISLRFAPVFGRSPVESPTRAIPLIINQILTGKEVTVMPWETAFFYLDDLSPILARLIDAPLKRSDSVLNLGPHLKRYSQEEVARILIRFSHRNVPVRVINAPPRQDELLDTSRARRILCLSETPIEKALEETHRYFTSSAII